MPSLLYTFFAQGLIEWTRLGIRLRSLRVGLKRGEKNRENRREKIERERERERGEKERGRERINKEIRNRGQREKLGKNIKMNVKKHGLHPLVALVHSFFVVGEIGRKAKKRKETYRERARERNTGYSRRKETYTFKKET